MQGRSDEVEAMLEQRLDRERYQQARKRLEARLDLLGHAASYAMVNLMLFAINLLSSPGEWWFFWPLLGWGIGLASHAFSALGKEWQERQIGALLERDGLQRPERRRAGEASRSAAGEDGPLWPNL